MQALKDNTVVLLGNFPTIISHVIFNISKPSRKKTLYMATKSKGELRTWYFKDETSSKLKIQGFHLIFLFQNDKLDPYISWGMEQQRQEFSLSCLNIHTLGDVWTYILNFHPHGKKSEIFHQLMNGSFI